MSSRRPSPTRIVSGGQTGADRAALDVAAALGLPRGGWVPRGRWAEDGRLPESYDGMVEAPTAEPAERTQLNVRDADATLVVCFGPPQGGTAWTVEVARELGRPVLVLDLERMPDAEAVVRLRRWLDEIAPETLNVAGPRASEAQGIYDATVALLSAVLGADRGDGWMGAGSKVGT